MRLLLSLLISLVLGVSVHGASGSDTPPTKITSSNSTVTVVFDQPGHTYDLSVATSGGATNGIQQLNGFGTNTTFNTATVHNGAHVDTNFVGRIINTNGPQWNVMAYGAKGDGITDDTAAVRATDDAAGLVGGTVYFPGGHTYLLDKLVLTNSNVRWLGDGANSLTTNCSIIKSKSLHGYALNVGDDTTQTLNVLLENLNWEGNGTNADFTLMLGGGCENVTVRNCSFHDGNRMLYITGGTNNYSRQIYIEGCQFLNDRTDNDGAITVAYPASGTNFLQTVVFDRCSGHITSQGYALVIDGVNTYFFGCYWGLASLHGIKFQDTSSATGHTTGGSNGWGNEVNSHDPTPILIESSVGGWDTLGNLMPGTKNVVRYKDSSGTIITNQSYAVAIPVATGIANPVIEGGNLYFSSTMNNPATPNFKLTFNTAGNIQWNNSISGGTFDFNNSTNGSMLTLKDGSPVTPHGDFELKDWGGALKFKVLDGDDIYLFPAGQVRISGTNYARLVVQTTDLKQGTFTVLPTSGNVSVNAVGATSVLQLAANGVVHLDLDDVGNVRTLPKNGVFLINDFYNTNAVTQLAFLKNAPGLQPNIQAQNDGGFKIQAVGSGIVTIPTSLSVGTNVDTVTLSQGGTKILTAGQHLTNIADIGSGSGVAMTLSGTNVSVIGELSADTLDATNGIKSAGTSYIGFGSGAINLTGRLAVTHITNVADLASTTAIGVVLSGTNVSAIGGITADNVHATNGVTSGGFVFKQVALTQGVSPLVDSTNQTLDFAQGMYQIWTLTNDVCLNAFSGSPSAATIKFRANGGNRNVLISTNWMPLNVQGGTANGSYYQFILTNGTQFSTLSAWATGSDATNVAAVWANF